MDENKNTEPLASEIYKDLKLELKRKQILIYILIALLAFSLIMWTQYDTIVVDSGQGGYANYVGTENAGGIYNGEGYSTQAQEWQEQGNAG